MNKKTSKHRAEKHVAAPSSKKLSPSSRLSIYFYLDLDGDHRWRAMRSGRVLAESGESYIKKDKMKRSFLRLAESFAKGQWRVEDEAAS